MLIIIIMMVMIMTIMMLLQVGPGDDYVLTVGGFNDNLSTLGDSMITPWSDYNLNGMRFTTR